MDPLWKTSLWQQFTATIGMLDSALQKCPDELWTESMWADRNMPAGFSAFWYVAYHTLFWLDLYLSGAAEGFAPPAPFTLAELDPAGVLPERVYTRVELRSYLAHCRRKCQATIEGLTDERAQQTCRFSWGEMPFAELLLDTMRHVQEHGAQLNMFLGQRAGAESRWITKDSG